MSFRETELVLLTADLAGSGTGPRRTCRRSRSPRSSTAGTDRSRAILGARGGRVVKYMGDACLATFPTDRCADAVDAALELQRIDHRAAGGLPVGTGVQVHLGVVAEGGSGPAPIGATTSSAAP